MSLASNISQQLIRSLSGNAADSSLILNSALRLLSKWRSVLIQNTFLEREGTKVLKGPLAGLDFIEQSTDVSTSQSCSAAMSSRGICIFREPYQSATPR
jgi:hypothetical protein